VIGKSGRILQGFLFSSSF